LGPVDILKEPALREIRINNKKILYMSDKFGRRSAVCAKFNSEPYLLRKIEQNP